MSSVRNVFFRSLPVLTYLALLLPLLGKYLGESVFLFELFSHFPLQLAAVAGVLMAYWLGNKKWSYALVALVAVLLNATIVHSAVYANTSTRPERPADVRVFHANVLYTREDYRPIVDTIRQLKPDFFVLHEMTPEGGRAVSSLRREYPYQDSIWAKGPCYIMVGSRTPFTVDSVARRSHRVIALTSTVRGKTMSLVTVHPRTPLLPSWFAERNRQLEFVAREVAQYTHPAVLIGDLNISPFSPIFRRHFRERQLLIASRERFGYTPTWPRFLPPLFIPIDHALTNIGFQTLNFRTLTTPGSDHRAICVDLVYR